MSQFTPHRTRQQAGRDGFPQLLRAEWTRFRTGLGWVLTMAASVLVTVALGLLIAGGARTACAIGAGEGPCPPPLVGPDGTAVRDRYYFVHQPLQGNGSITARVSDMTGQVRLQDTVPGVHAGYKEAVVPWAKAGLLVRQSLKRGTPYAAVMITGAHGVRMQHNYVHDVAGSPVQGPRWLRLTRSDDTITGYESGDGQRWTEVSTVTFTWLPETVEIGLFATAPGVQWETAKAFAQATATFDQIELRGANGSWRHDDVGVTMKEDGKTPHHPGGVVESGDKLIVTGGGDIGPATVEGGMRADFTLIGGALGLILVLVVAVTFFTAEHRRGLIGTSPPAAPHPARLLAAQAAVIGAVAFVAGLATAGVVVPAGLAMLRANQNPIQPITLGTELRVIFGYAALTAAAAVLAVGLAALVKRAIAAIGLAIALVVVPYLLGTAGLAPWLLAFTPAAGFAITQSVPTFAHVDVNPSLLLGGHYPLPPWAGLAVTCGYAGVALGVALAAHRRRPPG
ncbi:DUF1349 domain-containing protein [Nonomuraea turkmeniaca]|uniref:DUF1349 domain-containing protein n=1 Tax=Nonomuraea turkmeniaca TaxID=103838 RepID=A0A5S4FS16_9ACTN|nr:DUF1349 domain-containing protein [Nonomuraea turkmeniaca]TMR23423.1 DUF1349 domain-containing protein [Nonomuraea turkmeniaca]